MSQELLKILRPEDLRTRRRPVVDAQTMTEASTIVEEVRTGAVEALRSLAQRWDDLAPDAALVHDRDDLARALAGLDPQRRGLLQRTRDRIVHFATAQRECLRELELSIEGGRAGHRLLPIERVGCYAPGGRYPLPSSVLMTAAVARAAGVPQIWVASPRPDQVTLAAAALSGADGLLAVGGAQAIAALAFGSASPEVDMICGPGNRWVTAAKKYLFGEVGIDMLAGPSELVVIADSDANPRWVVADLLAQAEHDVDAVPILISDDESLIRACQAELVLQLEDLSSADTARAALRNGCAILTADLEEAARCSDRLAPEHLSLALKKPEELSLRHYGALFVGGHSAEVFGDYGAGPNHVLPTGRGARFGAGLSVFSFLRSPSFLQLGPNESLALDAAELGRLEGLEAHARSSELRLGTEAHRSLP